MNTSMGVAEPGNAKKAVVISAGLLVVGVIIALIVAFAAGGDDEVTDGTAARNSRIPQGAARQVSFAELHGASLPRQVPGTLDEAIGMDAPAFTASYYDNTETTLDPSDGNPRIIMFLAHW